MVRSRAHDLLDGLSARDAALGSGVSVGGLLVGIAQHDAYHIGQLALLRRALEQR